ncbi:MAG TPA: BON domain-containing protein [Methylophilaceae bacterium]|jgi:hyperosmotically inducible protein
MNSNKTKLAAFAIACSLGLGLTACSQTHSAENTGQETADNNSPAIKDAATTAKIKTAILTEPGLKSFQITVTTRDGVVDLTGTVDTQANRDKAQQVAERFSGVKFVENQLVVAPS